MQPKPKTHHQTKSQSFKALTASNTSMQAPCRGTQHSNSVLIIIPLSLAILLYITFIPLASAATINGKIYDLSYAPIDKVLVTINSTPSQTYVAESGSYTFYLPQGTYLLTAAFGSEGSGRQMSEHITISDDGNYTLDLVLYDELSNITTPDEDIQNISTALEELSNATTTKPQTGTGVTASIIAVIIILIGLIIAYTYWTSNTRKKTPETLIHNTHEKKEETTHTQKTNIPATKTPKTDPRETILTYLTQNEGRANQKDIRKLIPYSEAKISLLITELEHEGKLKRIKKGRGNIIILQSPTDSQEPNTTTKED